MARCPICHSEYKKWRMSQKVCGNPECAIKYAEKTRIKQELKEYRKRKLAIKTRTEWLKDAQFAVNRYVRERDKQKGYPCISCLTHTGVMQAGHYRSVGAAPHLRFNEDNIHLQCAQCNTYKSGNAIEYRINLVKRIGEEAVLALENNNEIVKWTIEDAKRIKDEYTRKHRELIGSNRTSQQYV